MKNPFKYVKDEEWDALTANAEVRRFKADEVLVAEGSKPRGMLAVDRGDVKVCRSPGGYRLVIAELGPGAIFGEMSFIESVPAEVSVIAATDGEALFISHEQMKAEIKQRPALYGRFYQSLAWILSRRLRETTEKVTMGNEDTWKDD